MFQQKLVIGANIVVYYFMWYLANQTDLLLPFSVVKPYNYYQTETRSVQVGCHERQSKRVINKHFRFNLPPFCFHFLRTKCRSSYIYTYLLFFGSLAAFTLIKIHRKVDLFCFFSLSFSPAQTFVTDKCDRET